jgi:hypothetical protein
VLEARVLALGVLTDDGKVDVGVAGREAGERLAEDDGCVDVELLAHGDVPGDVARLDGCEKDAWRGFKVRIDSSETTQKERTLEADAVALERLERLLEKLLAARGYA